MLPPLECQTFADDEHGSTCNMPAEFVVVCDSPTDGSDTYQFCRGHMSQFLADQFREGSGDFTYHVTSYENHFKEALNATVA